MLIIRKVGYFPTLARNVVYHEIQQENKIRQIQDIGQVSNQTNFVVFANFVYDITPLYNNHPAGYQVINAVKSRQVDRFLYGMYPPEKVPEIGIYSHSYRSLSLLGSPLAKISIPSTFTGMQAINTCQVAYRINYGEHFYVLGLQAAQNEPFIYKGYQSLKQFGRYYAVNIGGITRLYTVVNCLRIQNIEGIKGLSLSSTKQYKKKNNDKFISLKTQQDMIEAETINEDPICIATEFDIKKKVNQITIMFKKYQKGALIPILAKIKEKSIINVSHQRGVGMRLGQIKEGQLFFIAGGTGLCPFMDLIDLLFKAEVIKNKKGEKNMLQKANPILSNINVFEPFTFTFLIAANDKKDIHPLTLFQLHYLASQNLTFRCILRIRDSQNNMRQEYPGFNYIQEKFDGMLKVLLRQKNPVKIFICGPPILNNAMLQFMKQQQINEEKNVIM